MTQPCDVNREHALRVALTGGVGAGKSTLGAMLERMGAYRIDADQVARDVVAPGSVGLVALRQRFGPEVLGSDGTLDRAGLARTVFDDTAARRDLNAILHPLIAARARDLMATAPAGVIVVYEIPLLVETGRGIDFDVVVTVEASMDVRLSRLRGRGLGGTDALARISSQASDEQRCAIADEVVVNDGSTAQLNDQAVAVWNRILARQPAGGGSTQ